MPFWDVGRPENRGGMPILLQTALQKQQTPHTHTGTAVWLQIRCKCSQKPGSHRRFAPLTARGRVAP
jgi:hypothetical protein